MCLVLVNIIINTIGQSGSASVHCDAPTVERNNIFTVSRVPAGVYYCRRRTRVRRGRFHVVDEKTQ